MKNIKINWENVTGPPVFTFSRPKMEKPGQYVKSVQS